MTNQQVIIDTDPGIDDAIALALALYSKELTIPLITTVSGNVSLEKVTENALKLVTFYQQQIPVAKGAGQPLMRAAKDASDVHGASGMEGYDFPAVNHGLLLANHAVVEMARVLAASQEKMTICAIGPLTNVALLIRMFPELIEKVGEIVLMGGALGRGNFGVLSEFNIAVDPEAAKIVFEADLNLVMVPLDVGLKALVYPEDSEKIKTMNPVGNMMYHLFKKYRGGSFATGLKMYDSCAVAYLLKPEMFTVQEVYVGIETAGELTAGATIVDLNKKLGKKANCRVCTDLNEVEFKKWFLTNIEKCN